MFLNLKELDEKIIPMVKYFNDNNLETKMSCQGHNKTNMSMFWISFSKEVKEKDIISFMRNHVNEYNNFCSNGRFVQRLFVWNDNKTSYTWQYMAATIEAANEDLKNWKEQDKCRVSLMVECQTDNLVM